MTRALSPSLCSLPLALLLALPLAAQDPTDAQHYRIELELLFATRTIQAKTTATFVSKVDNLSTIDLDLVTQLVVSGVTMNAAPVTFTRPTDKVRITLDRAYQRNESFSVEVSYAGTPAGGGFGGFVFTTHGSAASPMAWSLSEPWYSRTWWPVKETLTDKSTAEIWVTHPDTMLCASNGVLQGTDTLSGNRLRTRWGTTAPIIPYLISVAVTNYQRRTDTYTHLGASMPVEFFVFPESWTSWQSGMNLIVPMLTAFSNVYGQYPFVTEKYGIAQFTWGGGMEHQTITSQSSVSEYLSAHELAHQWWGDLVTCATWHDIWLNEGFATFSEAVWAENKSGGGRSAYLSRMAANKPTSVTGSAYVYDIGNENNIFSTNNVYRRGAWVMHQLRHVLGDAAFFKALADYRAAFAGRSATTAEFAGVVRTSSGRDLQWFFDQWVMRNGAPSYRSAWKSVNLGGKDHLYLQIDQAQTAYPLFVMPIDVRVTTASGVKTYVVWDDELRDQFAIPIDAPATAVAIDPEDWILDTAPSSRVYAAPHFALEPEALDTTLGGASTLHLDHGTAAASRPYVVLAGASGSSPGTQLGSLLIPLNFDALTDLALQTINGAVFTSFYGTLDSQGLARATFNLPPGLALPLKGRSLTFAYVLIDTLDATSRPLTLRLE
ncbi:MAG: M1 family metallopeptidase [Planctomycetes bacterium]|nr:M1 family metallopeptidase [Planctomycetota bacterium]